jgi:2-polyprenyl-3-methyl-5-hydroxy-6-metoxy-1,4-benzoquinol methylase
VQAPSMLGQAQPTACCPVCGGATTAAFTSGHGHLVTQCVGLACGHLFIADPGERQGVELEEFSLSEVADSAALHREEFSERNSRLIDYWEQRNFLPTGAKVLDFGSSVGHVVQSLVARRPDLGVQCIEASAPSRYYLASAGLSVARCLEEVTGQYDAVLMIEVIEHLPDPVAILTRLCRLLKPGGQIFVTTPCGRLRSGNRSTRAYDRAEHIHFFTERSLQHACRRAGLESIGFEFVTAMYPLPTDAVGKVLATAKHSASRLRAVLEGHRHLVGFTSADSECAL